MREFAAGHNGQQPGDPGKLAQAIIELTSSSEPSLRLPLGTDAVKRIEKKDAFVEQELEKWRSLSVSTDL